MPSGPVAAVVVLALALLVGGIYLFVELRHHGGARARERARNGGERLPLFGTDGMVDRPTGAPVARPRPVLATSRTDDPLARRVTPAALSRSGAGPVAQPAPVAAPRTPADFAPPPPPPMPAPSPRPSAPRAAPARPMPAYADTGGGTLVAAAASVTPASTAVVPERSTDERFHDGETIRFSVPDEGTLQFLPGRLEVVGGPDRGREVRFVRTSGDDRVEVTFGRSEGPPYRHVQLMARTVSRQHAAMSLIEGHWQLKNMSGTNPVLLNGRSLEAGEIAPLLVEGDRIEMGEVVFCFHER